MNPFVEEYYIVHNSIMEEWKNRHESKGYTDFIYDGIINPELWFDPNNKDERILFILKEGLNKEKPGYATRWWHDRGCNYVFGWNCVF